MEGLMSLIRVLRPSEKRLIKHFYARTTNDEEKLRLKLFKLVDSGKVKEDATAREKLLGTRTTSAYSHLKTRLKSDILNVLLMQESSKRFAQANRAAEFDCRKKIALLHILLLRGARIEGMKVMKQALNLADRYELLAERLQINHLLREKFIGTGSSIELNRLNDAISHDMKRYEALLYVEEQSFLLSSPEFNRKLQERTNDKEYLSLIEELGKLFKKYKLARIGFWYYMAATDFGATQRDFEKVILLGLKFLKLVEKSPAVKSKNNIAGVNQTLGSAYIELRNFSEAIKHLLEAEKLFPSSGFNRLQCLQFMTQAAIASGQYERAVEHIEAAFTHPRIKLRDPLIPRWTFMRSALEFLSGDVDASFKTINKDSYILGQRDEWNMQYRLLELMQLVEMGDEEWLDFKINTTRKFLARNKELDTPRVRAAMEVLSNLLRKELKFDALSDKSIEVLRSCLEEDKGYEWSPTGPELVRFDLWVDKKRIPYIER